ncbi:unnamed protein product [Calypogeia fissa]
MAPKTVISVFAVTSLLMWAFPLGVLLVLSRNLIPGLENMSPRLKTLWSGGLAVFSVNVVIVIYIFLALREPPVAVPPQPDPAFARRARALQAEFAGNQATLSNPPKTVSQPEIAEKGSKSD